MKRAFEYVKGMRFHSLDEIVNTLKDAGFEVEDCTKQYVTVWENGKLIVLMLCGRFDNFAVCYAY